VYLTISMVKCLRSHLVCIVCCAREEAEYVNRLKDVERHSYLAKVQSLGIGSCPYSICKTEWVDDMKLWPPVTFPDVYSYLVDTPGDLTREKLKAFKSLDAYNFVISATPCAETRFRLSFQRRVLHHPW